jgi:hypothetical protein
MATPEPMDVARNRDRDPDRVRAKLAECLARLKDPNDALTWSQIKKDYGRFGVSKRMVHEHMRGIEPARAPRGRPRALSARQEESVVDHLLLCEQRGFAMTQSQAGAELIGPMASLQATYPFKVSTSGERLGPSKLWWRRFHKRHRDRLRVNRAASLAYARAAAATPRAFTSVCDMLRGRMHVAENIVVMDETAVPAECGWERRVLGAPSSTPAHIPGGAIDQRHMTLAATCTAAGSMLPPAYICAGKSVLEVSAACERAAPRAVRRRTHASPAPEHGLQSWRVHELPRGGLLAVSDHGGMTKELFNTLLTDHIGPWLLRNGQPGRKVILIDGDGSHEPLPRTLDWLRTHDMDLFRLPAHLTHLLCPLDVSVFGPLKAHFRRLLRHEMHAGTIRVDVADRWRLMDRALDAIAPAVIKRGWERSGLYPFNENKWQEEKWAEPSVSLNPAGAPSTSRPRQLLHAELGEQLLSEALSAEQKDARIRQYVRENPSEQDVLQAALPRPQLPSGARRRGRQEHAVMAWMTSDDAVERAMARQADVVERQQLALCRAERKQARARVKQLQQAAADAYARATAAGDAPAPSSAAEELQAARGMALEAVRVQAAQGVGKMCAMKAKKLVRLADRGLGVLAARNADDATAAGAPATQDAPGSENRSTFLAAGDAGPAGAVGEASTSPSAAQADPPPTATHAWPDDASLRQCGHEAALPVVPALEEPASRATRGAAARTAAARQGELEARASTRRGRRV